MGPVISDDELVIPSVLIENSGCPRLFHSPCHLADMSFLIAVPTLSNLFFTIPEQ
jgi:hypothetical protein